MASPRSDTRTIIGALRKIAIRCEQLAHAAASDGDAMDQIIHASALREAADRMEEMRLALLPLARMEETLSCARDDHAVMTRSVPPDEGDADHQDVLVAGDGNGFSALTRGVFRAAKRLTADKEG